MEIEYDLNLINNELIKLGEQPLEAIYGSWTNNKITLLVPCGHIICTFLLKNTIIFNLNKDTNIYSIDCPYCNKQCKTYKLKIYQFIDKLGKNNKKIGWIKWIKNIYWGEETIRKINIKYSLKLYEENLILLKKNYNSLNIGSNELNKTMSFTYIFKDNGKNGLIKLKNESRDQASLDIIFLFDVSESMTGYFEDFCEMTRSTIKYLQGKDRFTLITVNSLGITQPFPLQPVNSLVREKMVEQIYPNKYWGNKSFDINITVDIINTILNPDMNIEKSDRVMYCFIITNNKISNINLPKGPNIVNKICILKGSGIEKNDFIYLETINDLDIIIKSIISRRSYIVATNINFKNNYLDKLWSNEEIRWAIQKNDENSILSYLKNGVKYTMRSTCEL